MVQTLLPCPSSCTLTEGFFEFPATLKVKGDLGDLTEEWLGDIETLFGQKVNFRAAKDERPDLTITCKKPDEAPPTFETLERYDLRVSPTGIFIQAPTPVGIRYAFQTLLQLAEANGSPRIPACEISDEPRFVWRGLMLDVARHFMPMELVRRVVDGMGRVKLNVLHLGLSNNQGFRVESKIFPRLHTAASDGDYYSQEAITGLIAWAGRRGVRVVPEFNMPGHSTAFLVAYNELSAGPPPKELRQTSGVFDDEMNPASPHTDRFVGKFIEEMAQLFPDEYWHFGGDEVTGKAWDADPSVRAFMKDMDLRDNHELQALFTDRVLAHLSLNKKKGVGWEEVAHGLPPTDTVIQPWISPASAAPFKDYPLIVSTGFYLDHFFKASDYYGFDPETDEDGPDVIGAEACLWSEVMNADNVEAIMWPSLMGLAERFWSPRAACDADTLEARLDKTREMFEALQCADYEAPDRLAAKLCGGRVPRAVQTLRDYIGPLVYYFALGRSANPHDVSVPFSRLIETMVPETAAAREFERLVDLALDSDMKPLTQELTRLAHLDADFAHATEDRPELAENQVLADMIARLARGTLGFLEGGTLPQDLPFEALQSARTPDLTGALEAVGRRRSSDLPRLLQETNILILPALARLLGR